MAFRLMGQNRGNSSTFGNSLETPTKISIFDSTVIFVILLNTVLLGLETSKSIMSIYSEQITILNSAILIFFVGEIVYKIIVLKKEFFKDGFNIFDFSVVAVSVLVEYGFSSFIGIVRIMRIVRGLRLFTCHNAIREIVKSMMSSIPRVGWIMIFLIIDMYFFGLIGFALYHDSFPEYFGSLGTTMYTLIEIMTFDGWSSGIARNIVEANPLNFFYFIFYIAITAFVLLNVLVGVVVDVVGRESEINDSKKRAAKIISAFKREEKITARKIQKKLNIPESRRSIGFSKAMTRLMYSSEEIYKAVESVDDLRIRACKLTPDSPDENNLVIECFPKNTSFGCFVDRKSNIHVISTQNRGEPNVGHYSRLLAEMLDANYYSNEFFSGGEMLVEKQIDFTVNTWYKEETTKTPLAFKEWKKILFKQIAKGNLVIYIGVRNIKHKELFEIRCGGDVSNLISEVKSPTVDNLQYVESFLKDFRIGISAIKLQPEEILKKLKLNDSLVSEHTERNTNKNHLTHILRDKTEANVLYIAISHGMLQFLDINNYYESLRILADSINKNLIANDKGKE